MPIREEEPPAEMVTGFLEGVRNQFPNSRIDSFVLRCFGTGDTVSTMTVPMNGSEDFILFLLGTVRGREKSAPYTVAFSEGYIERDGYHLPQVSFHRKEGTADASGL